MRACPCLSLIALVLCGFSSVQALSFSVKEMPRTPVYVRGNENIFPRDGIDGADWIWAPGAAEGAEFARFRVPFELSTPSFSFDVSADERYQLFLDGKPIGRGPVRGVVEHWYYHSYEVSDIAPGKHVLEAVVSHLGDAAPNAQVSFRGGFVLKAFGELDACLTTGTAPWKVARLGNTVMTGRGTDGAFGVGCESSSRGCGFDDEMPDASAWTEPAVVRKRIAANYWGGRADGWMLYPADRPAPLANVVRPGAFRAAMESSGDADDFRDVDAESAWLEPFNALLKGGRVVVPPQTRLRLAWDLGNYYCAYPHLTLGKGAGAKVRWSWAESMRTGHARKARNNPKGNRGTFEGKCFSGRFGDTFVADGRERAHFSAPWWRAGRWCELVVETQDEPLTIDGLSLEETHYPIDVEASFSCDDEFFARVGKICLRGMEMCVHDMTFDCPYYEQQMYPGDSRIQLEILNSLSRDTRMQRFVMSAFDFGQRDNGLVPMNFPGRHKQESATYTMCWVMMFKDYLDWQGDLDFLRQRMPAVRKALMGLSLYEDENGLVKKLPGWSFVDWVRGDLSFENGYAPDGKTGVSAINNLQYLLALRSAEAVDAALGEIHFAACWKDRADRLAARLKETFMDKTRGILADTVSHDRFSEHAQALAILGGMLTDEERLRAIGALEKRTGLSEASSYFAYYLFRAFAECGRADLIRDRLSVWRDFLDSDARTAYETQFVNATRSDCHAWSSCPLYFFQTAFAGVTPAAPGFTSVRIAPQPAGLKRISSRTPTPRGIVETDLVFSDGRASGKVVLPSGMTGVFVYGGLTQNLHAGANVVARPPETVSSAGLSVTFDSTQNGAVAQIASARGLRFSADSSVPLLRLVAFRTADPSVTCETTSSSAKDFAFARVSEGVHLVWRDMGEAFEAASADVSADASGKLRWSLTVAMRPGWTLEKSSFPCLALARELGGDGADDGLVVGSVKGGVRRNPSDESVMPTGSAIKFVQPGGLAAQFVSYWDSQALFYTAAEDASGQEKSVLVYKSGSHFELRWTHLFPDPGADGLCRMPYDVVTLAQDADTARPCDWYDAADIYRTWAENQSWCRVKFLDRQDVPSWMKDAPVFARFDRAWAVDPDSIRGWAIDRWQRKYPGVPLVAAVWGWEKWGEWVGADYFPMSCGDDAFRALATDLRQNGVYPFLWPSSYFRALNFGLREDGAYRYDDRVRFLRDDSSHAVCRRDGSVFEKGCWWLEEGTNTCYCAGDAWSRRWWNVSVIEPLLSCGVQLVQFDQSVGGSIPDCWSGAHGHSLGGGAWKHAAIVRQMESMSRLVQDRGTELLFGFEEPNELLLGKVGIQDYRDCQTDCGEVADLFGYIYHEYVPLFQSNHRSRDRFWMAHECAEGQMPNFIPMRREVSTDDDRRVDRFMSEWVRVYRGEGRPFLAYGRRIRPPSLSCRKVPYQMKFGTHKKRSPISRMMPVISHAAYRASDGRTALVLVNATGEDQSGVLKFDDGVERPVQVPADGIVLMPLDPRPENVPKLLVTEAGEQVSSRESWERRRRPEILRYFTDNVYGRRPCERPPHLDFEAIAPDREMMDGRAIRKLVKITYGGAFGTNSFVVTSFIPKDVGKPVPAFLLICNRPPDVNLDPERIQRTEFWPAEEIVARGYAAVAFYNGDLSPDFWHGNSLGAFPALSDVRQKYPDVSRWGMLSCWAWGASRVLDWMANEPLLDAGHVAVVGHSRGGKTALVAAAFDERFAMACVNDSGGGGVKLHHIDLPGSEHIADSVSRHAHWYAPKYATLANRGRELPYDTHEMAALIAPRLLCVGSATQDAWAGPEGEFWATALASPAWELYGRKGLVSKDSLPRPDTPLQEGDVSYHCRRGKHDLTLYDWRVYMDFADRHGWRVGK